MSVFNTYGSKSDKRHLQSIAVGSKLMAMKHRGLITIEGSCGQGHTMNYAEARQLRDWLIANVPEKPDACFWLGSELS